MTDSPIFLESAAEAVVEDGLMSREEFFVLTNAAEDELC